MIPNLKELLNERTVLLLGAGASFDYKFPLWNQVKEDLLHKLGDLESNGIKVSDSVNWWIEKLSNMTDDQTVDKLATEAPEEYYDLLNS